MQGSSNRGATSDAATGTSKGQKFFVIGIGDGPVAELPPREAEIVASAKVFSGGKRHRELVGHLLPDGALWIEISVPIDDTLRRYEGHDRVVVFASGDPLFYGFANTLRRRLPNAELEVFPTFNSLQMLAHRTLLDYATMRCISLTGRAWDALDAALISGEPLVGALTDGRKTPSEIARRMLEYGYDNYRMTVGESLGNPASEKVHEVALQEAAGMHFSAPNCVILERIYTKTHPLGIPEGEFALLDGRIRMITKAPIRILTLSRLSLERCRVMWDIGFCTGSVSVEARLHFPRLKVVAFEIREEGEALMAENSRRHGAPGIEVVTGNFLEADLASYPPPEAIFIGGHGGELPAIMERSAAFLQPGGKIVMNSVTGESRDTFLAEARRLGLETEAPLHVAIDEHNPIDILSATLPHAENGAGIKG